MRKHITTSFEIAQLNDTRLQLRIKRIEARERRKQIWWFAFNSFVCFVASFVMFLLVKGHKLR